MWLWSFLSRCSQAKALVLTDALGDGCGFGEAVPRSLGLCWAGMGFRICL